MKRQIVNPTSEMVKGSPLNKIRESNNSLDPSVDAEKENALWNKKHSGLKDKHKHKVFIWSLYILWAIAVLLLSTRVAHFILPDCLQWLDKTSVQSLDKLLFSGAVGTLLGKYGNKIVD